MKCLNCGYHISHGYLCPQCGVDVYVYQKIRNSSIRLYNCGLKQAKAQNLSGAIQSLEQSVLFDKDNIQARNLLGLVYCEVGQIADALKHWIISSSIQPENNPSVGYMEILQKNPRTMEKWNDAVRAYNEAIGYLHQGSEDLAVIQLKRAMDSNKNFIAAQNLMTLCCIQENNLDRARHFIESVLKRDIANPLALHYAESINFSVSEKNAKPQKKKSKELKKTDPSVATAPYKRYDKKQNSGGKSQLFSFLLGCVCTVIVVFTLVVPALDEQKNTKIQELQKKVSGQETSPNSTSQELEELNAQIAALKEENESYRIQLDLQKNITAMQTAQSFMDDDNYEDAAATLLAIDTTGFSEEEKAQYQQMKELAFPKAANKLYTKGKSAYINHNYSEAQNYLENSLKYTVNDDFIDDALYYLGKIAESNSDIETAKQYYSRIVENHPDSNQYANAKNSLQQLTE
ncbi:MAG: tetratricopeptide repeat protein [Epulopiscium sp.]|nr:tetratricopeptide repeat protein [Candidatus Epulonipiscium sp.]